MYIDFSLEYLLNWEIVKILYAFYGKIFLTQSEVVTDEIQEQMLYNPHYSIGGNDANQIDDLSSNGTISNSENSDDGDRDFDINAYLYDGEKLDGVIDSEEYESDEIESEDEINNNEFNNKVKEKTLSDRESINFEEAHQNVEETLAEKLKVSIDRIK